MAEHYDFKETEEKIKKFWEREKIYKFNSKKKGKIYSIDTPPPTVSGKMHIGHAFSYAQQDFVIRFRRMAGFNVFYPFGTDDNGLPTERLVEKTKGVKARDMSRQEFIDLCANFLKQELPGFIQDWKNIGISCDFDIYYSTINEHSRRISQWSFLDLYKKERAYRKRAAFMWCPECRTAISQMEMKDKTEESDFVYIKFKTNLGEQIVIATTRPELMPACIAVHVHPDDKRYKKFIGKKAKLPIFNREVEIYANKDVDMDFGTGAVYHCTFGDMDDVKWIEEMKIKPIEVMNKDGTLNEKAGKYKGMKSAEARKEIIKDLKEIGAIQKIEKIEHAVKVHERCDTPIEILMTEQWFIKYLDLKNEMLKWGTKLNWYPKFMKTRYDNWVKGLKWDWCISRQRYFGVPFPVWYCKKCGSVILAEEKQLPVDPLKDKPIKKCQCGSSEFEPEKDVLDTWFTSSMTPQLAIKLMPKAVQKRIFPMSLRPQAHDIITFWLFNTVFKSNIYFKKNPWSDVMISGFVTLEGEKMSKSKGNIIEPQEIVEKYGADVLRYGASSSKLGEDSDFREKEMIAGKKLIIKLYNAARFIFMNINKSNKIKKPKKLIETDKLYLIKLNKIIEKATKYFENYEYAKAKAEIENFFWDDFTSDYLEIVKNRIYNKKGNERDSAIYTLYQIFLAILKMFAPIVPYITEEIYQENFKRNEKEKSIHLCSWPEKFKIQKKKQDKEIFNAFKEILNTVRQEKSKAGKSVKAEIILTIEKKHKEKIRDKNLLEDLKAVTNAREIREGKFKVEFI